MEVKSKIEVKNIAIFVDQVLSDQMGVRPKMKIENVATFVGQVVK